MDVVPKRLEEFNRISAIKNLSTWHVTQVLAIK